MPKITVVQVVYNSKKYMEACFHSVYSQTFKDFRVVAVIAGDDDGGKEYLQEHFPEMEIIGPGFNIGFAAGHNLVFEKYSDSEFFFLLNPDLVLEPDFFEKLLPAFENPRVAASVGKTLRYDFDRGMKTNVIDTCGQEIDSAGRTYERGQDEEDSGRFDEATEVWGFSGCSVMLRGAALRQVESRRPRTQCRGGKLKVENKMQNPDELTTRHSPLATCSQVFDPDFGSYWEDTDLAWRLHNAGFKTLYLPDAVCYHGRQSKPFTGNKWNLLDYLKHRKTVPLYIRQKGFENWIYTYIKNSPHVSLAFLMRATEAVLFIFLFEWSLVPSIFRVAKNTPKFYAKRFKILDS
jgi:GT2 family glycosyltransferase